MPTATKDYQPGDVISRSELPSSESNELTACSASDKDESGEKSTKSDDVEENAIELVSSMFGHSCRPNASWTVTGNSMTVRALTPIKSGEDIFVSYIPILLSTRLRRELLRPSFHVLCGCDRCVHGPNILYVHPGVFCPAVAGLFETDSNFKKALITRPKFGDESDECAKPDTRVDAYEVVGLMSRLISAVQQSLDRDIQEGEKVEDQIVHRARMLRGTLATFLEMIRIYYTALNYHIPRSEWTKVEFHFLSLDGFYNDLCIVIRELYIGHQQMSFDWKLSARIRDASRLSLAELDAIRNVLARAARSIVVCCGKDSDEYQRFVQDIWNPVMKEYLEGKYGPGAADKALADACEKWLPPVGIDPEDTDYQALTRVPPRQLDMGQPPTNEYKVDY